MKTLKITLMALSFGLMSFMSEPAIKEPFYNHVSGSALVWKADSIDLGEIPQNKPKDIVFEFQNTGKTDVVITNVKPSCGCTAADYTKTPVKPGETATVKATYNAAAKGAFTKTVTVTTNVDASPKILTFKGTVI